ncbi:MAG: MurR/RpiR family transcriptional regulator [Nitratireductor sp.]|nr:MurR/RpiR family transcriptional regulator [Nitratireductor sp.]
MQVRQKLEEMAGQLTPAERQLSSVLLADYPFAGLEPIQELSRKARISAPSISRFVSKLGYAGFQEFQQKLVRELKQGLRSPIDLWEDHAIDREAPLASYLQRIEALNADLLNRVSPAQFDRVCELLVDPKRKIYMIGGRMSDSIAGFFARHLRQIRREIYHIPSDPEQWPEYLLRLRPKDIVLIIDFRRYQASLERLSERARDRKAQTIVITDQWISPCAKGATELLAVPIGSGTLWDSYVPAFALVEALLIPLAERDWDATRERIAAWDELRDEPKEGIGDQGE